MKILYKHHQEKKYSSISVVFTFTDSSLFPACLSNFHKLNAAKIQQYDLGRD